MKKYNSYKDSGIKWIGNIPASWQIKRLKFLSDITPSNVDKKSEEGEKKVFLCNYVDVYKNDLIGKTISFMEATASDMQIQKLQLHEDDVIATKDSEDPYDIGVPSYVQTTLTDVVCGYHLTLFRTYKDVLSGYFLYWFLRSNNCLQYFFTEARGITRYALGSNAFKNLQIPFPAIKEQLIIAEYLKDKTSKIDVLVNKKKQLINLLKEERKTIINNAVTKGIDINVKLKDSGIGWIGVIPEHWHITKLKYILKTTKGYAFKSELFSDKGIPVIKASDIKNKTIRKNITHYIDDNLLSDFKSVKLSTGDIIISTVGSAPEVLNSAVGQIGQIPACFDGALLNQNTVKLQVSEVSKLNNDYLFYLIQNDNYRSHLNLHAHGTANQASLKLADILNYYIALPTLDEQNCILKHIQKKTEEIDSIIKKTEKEIELMQEYKTALISEVVTGKVDVRNEVLV